MLSPKDFCDYCGKHISGINGVCSIRCEKALKEDIERMENRKKPKEVPLKPRPFRFKEDKSIIRKHIPVSWLLDGRKYMNYKANKINTKAKVVF